MLTLQCCHSQLKSIDDSRKIRNRILSNFEQASLPSTTPAERRNLLSFVVCGGGPTGVEFASELYDMINEDVLDYVGRHEESIYLIEYCWLLRHLNSTQNYFEKKPLYPFFNQEITFSIHTAKQSRNTQKQDLIGMVFTLLSMQEYVKSAKISLNMLSRAKMENLKSLRYLLALRFGQLELVRLFCHANIS